MLTLSERARGANRTSVASGEVLGLDVSPTTNQSAATSQIVWPAWEQAPRHGLSLLWLAVTRRRVEELSQRKEDWDTYGGSSLQKGAVDALIHALVVLDYAIQTPPAISLTTAGGLNAEWASGGYALDLEARPDGSVEVYFVDRQAAFEWEGRASDAPDLDKWMWQATVGY